MKLALGTVQFGLNYGVSNHHGKPSDSEVNHILSIAKEHDIHLLDTATGYGDSHHVLAKQQVAQNKFDLVTKLPPFQNKTFSPSDIKRYHALLDSLFLELDTESLYGVLFHQSDDLLKPGAQDIWHKLVALKQSGKIKKIGVSVYANANISALLSRYDIDIIQLPYNLLDRYFEKSGLLDSFKDRGIEVHARSAFLQGLLLMNDTQIPDYFNPWRAIFAEITALAKTLRTTKLTLCLAYLIKQKHIDKCLVGVNNAKELKQIVDAYQDACILAQDSLPDFSINEPALTNPALWSY